MSTTLIGESSGGGIGQTQEADAQAHTAVTNVADPALREAMASFDAISGPARLWMQDDVFVWKSAVRPEATWINVVGSAGSEASRLSDQMSTAIKEIVSEVVDVLPKLPVILEYISYRPWTEAIEIPPPDAVLAVHNLQTELGVPAQTVFAATGISKSTYANWTKTSATPRVGSQGRLWELVQLIVDLRGLLGGALKVWLHADPNRLNDLEHGQFDRLLAAASVEVSSGVVRPEAYAAFYAIGAPDDGEVGDAPPIVSSPRSAKTVPVGSRRRHA